MRILQLNSARSWGGGETHVASLTAALRARGHHVAIAARGPHRPEAPLPADFDLPVRNAADLAALWRLRRILAREKFDLLHAHLGRDYPIACAAVLGLPTRLVLTRHLLLPLRPNPLLRRVDQWIAPTRQIADAITRLHPRKLDLIPNGIDLDQYRFRPHSDHAPLRLGILGQIAPHKGHEDALAALGHPALGQLSLHLRIAGRGDPIYISKLRAQARSLPVEFMDFQPAADFLATVDILLLPSWDEPFGLVVLEAMAAGVPVIATDGGGPAAIIAAPDQGVLVPPRDPERLATAIRLLAHDPARRRAIGMAARLRVEAEFDVRQMAARIEALYTR